MSDNGDGTFYCVYVPIKAIKHTIIITWAGVNVPNSPFRVKAHCSEVCECQVPSSEGTDQSDCVCGYLGDDR